MHVKYTCIYSVLLHHYCITFYMCMSLNLIKSEMFILVCCIHSVLTHVILFGNKYEVIFSWGLYAYIPELRRCTKDILKPPPIEWQYVTFKTLNTFWYFMNTWEILVGTNVQY